MPSSTPMDRRIAVLQHTLNQRDSVVHAAEVDGAEDDAFDRAVAALRREKAAAEKKAAWATAKKGVKHARVTSKIRPAGNPNVTRLHPHGRAREWQQHAAAAAAAQQQQAKEQEQEAAAVEDVPTGALSLRSEPPARAPLASPKTVTWALDPLTGGPAAAAFGSPALEAASANARRAMTRGIRRATAWDESSRAALFIQKRVRRFLRWRREQRALEAAAQVEAAACTIQRRFRQGGDGGGPAHPVGVPWPSRPRGAALEARGGEHHSDGRSAHARLSPPRQRDSGGGGNPSGSAGHAGA